MCKFIGKSNERILCKLSKSEILKLYSIIHVAMETTKRQILPANQNFSSVYFSLAKFQLVTYNPSLAMIWQMTHTHKLLKLCSDTLSACFLVKNTFLVHNLSQPTFRTVKFHVTCAKSERTKKCDIPMAKVLICGILLYLIRAIPVTLRSVRRVINQWKVHDIFLPQGNTAVRHQQWKA